MTQTEMPSAKMQRYRWYNNVKWGPCYDPKTDAHYASATDVETLQEHYGPIPLNGLQVHNGHDYEWADEYPEPAQVVIDGQPFFQHQYFIAAPWDSDKCQKCGHPFMSHNNGRCPAT